MSETDPTGPSATLEMLTLLTSGAGEPAPDRLGLTDRLRLTDGIVELRKRGEIAAHLAAGATGAEDCLLTMARRTAERAGHPHA